MASEKNAAASGSVMMIALGVLIGSVVGILVPYVLVKYANYGGAGPAHLDQMRKVFGFALYTVPFGGIIGGTLVKRWRNRKHSSGGLAPNA